jgi:hypothetical protein
MAFRTQKISQMTPKGADLEATDLIEVSTIESGSYVTRSITGQELIDAIPAPSGFVPTSRTLTINGVTQDLSADRTFTIATGLTVGTTPIASGTIGRILFEGTGNVLQESANLFWDNTNGALQTTTTADGIVGFRAKSTTGQLKLRPYVNTAFGLVMESRNAADSAYLPVTIGGSKIQLSDGNVLINTTTDAGFRLDVNGTARVSDNLLLTNGIIATSSATTRLQGALNYFTHNRIASSGIHGFQISNYGSTTSFWRYDAGTGDIEFGNSTAYGVTFFANNLARTKMWSSGQWTMGSATAYNASALVAMESTTTGFLPPRMTQAQRNAIASPAIGLEIYQTDATEGKYIYKSSGWTYIG